MDVFMKNRFVRWTIIVLVLLNLSTLAMLWFVSSRRPSRPPDHPRQREEAASQFLQRELQLSDAQFKTYQQLRNDQKKQAEKINRQIMDLKEEMMGELFNAHPDTARALRLARRIGTIQVELERITFNHFLELRDLCGIEQREKLEALLRDFFHQHRPGGPPGREGQPPPRDGHPRPGPEDRDRPPPRGGR